MAVFINVNEDDQPGDTIGGYGDSRKGSVYDWVKYYIRVSDRARQVTYELASYRTQNLGKDGVPDALLFNDTLNSVPQELLISFLSFVLANDNNSMMLIVGMDIFCEDNVNTDWDTFYLLTINHFYLNFTSFQFYSSRQSKLIESLNCLKSEIFYIVELFDSVFTTRVASE